MQSAFRRAPKVPNLRRNITFYNKQLSQPPDCRTYSAEVTWPRQQSPASSRCPASHRCLYRLPHFRPDVKGKTRNFYFPANFFEKAFRLSVLQSFRLHNLLSGGPKREGKQVFLLSFEALIFPCRSLSLSRESCTDMPPLSAYDWADIHICNTSV